MLQCSKQKGAALISALLITAVTAILAVAIAVQERGLIHQTELAHNFDQTYLDLQGVQDWGRSVFSDYKQALLTNPSVASPTWLSIFPTQKFQRVVLTGQIIDQQGLFNLNDLAQSANQPRFEMLLETVDPHIKSQQALALAEALTSWLTQGGGDEDYYLRLKPPYRAAHQQMVSVTELRAVQGFNAVIYEALKPYITAIPEQGSTTLPININTASAPVLMTLSSMLTYNKARAVVSCVQSNKGFLELSNFQKICLAPLGISTLTDVTTTSNNVEVLAQARVGRQETTLRSFLVAQPPKNNRIQVTVAWQALQ